MDRYLHGVPCWIETTQPDPEAAAAFYAGLFGWEYERHEGSPYALAKLPGGDGYVAAVTGAEAKTASWNTYIWVDDADEVVARVAKAGGTVVTGPVDVGMDGRWAAFTDPAGALLKVWQPNAHRGADRVNEPGTWNFNELYTDDVEGAKAFYGEVFGWEADTIDFGYDESWMWRVNGYGDLLVQRDPGLRERQAADQAPSGFEDAVGWMAVAPEGTAPTWGISFSVEDADAAIERAVGGGADVLVPPYDAGPVRTAIIRDPQGAVVTLSKYTPPSESA